MNRRPGETVDQWYRRVAHSCYRCGEYYDDRDELNHHENQHGQSGTDG
jgi:hypothetical protein